MHTLTGLELYFEIKDGGTVIANNLKCGKKCYECYELWGFIQTWMSVRFSRKKKEEKKINHKIRLINLFLIEYRTA